MSKRSQEKSHVEDEEDEHRRKRKQEFVSGPQQSNPHLTEEMAQDAFLCNPCRELDLGNIFSMNISHGRGVRIQKLSVVDRPLDCKLCRFFDEAKWKIGKLGIGAAYELRAYSANRTFGLGVENLKDSVLLAVRQVHLYGHSSGVNSVSYIGSAEARQQSLAIRVVPQQIDWQVVRHPCNSVS